MTNSGIAGVVLVFSFTIGMGSGAWIDHGHMSNRIEKMTAAHAEELRLREVQRAKDEVAAREMERMLTVKAGQIEQDKTNEIARIRSTYTADLARLQNRPARQPTSASGMPQAATTCKGATGADLSRPDSEFLVRLAADADQLRTALSACYQAYDQVAK